MGLAKSSTATSLTQQPSYLFPTGGLPRMGAMPTPHKRTLTPADLAAAARLHKLWKSMPKDERPTQQQLAEVWDGEGEANQSLISQYMKGRIALNFRAVMFFARQLRVDPAAIRDDLPEQRLLQPAANEPEWGEVLGYAQAVGLGHGAEAQEYAETHKLKFRAESLARKRLNPSKLAVMYGQGDSMIPAIKPGDAILFDTSDTRPRDEKLYVIQWRDEYYVKRAEIIDDAVYFRADNPHGDHNWRKPKKMQSERDPINVIGRVRWLGSWTD